MFLIKEALAQTAPVANAAAEATASAPDTFKIIAQFALIFIVLYFILIRPQQKRVKKHEAELASITTGTKVIVSGIEGVVTKIENDGVLKVKIAKEVEITVLKGYVSAVVFDDKKGE